MPTAKKFKDKSPEEIHNILADAWLNISVDEGKLSNPLNWPAAFSAEPEQYLTYVMTRPEYFSFICKEVLNITLLPIQAVILKNLWEYKFPMLIASRGFGKAVKLDETIQTPTGPIKMRYINVGDKIYGRDGKICEVTNVFPQGKKQVCRLTLLDGRQIDCCEDHLWVVKEQRKEKILSTKDIINSGIRYSKTTSGGHVYKFKIPNCQPVQYSKKRLPIDPYLLGCLLGDGCLTTLTPKIASNDDFIIDQFKLKLPEFEIKKDPTNNNYTIVDKNKEKDRKNRFTQIIKSNKLNVGCKDKFIPINYKQSCIEDRYELVRGLLDTDGSINENGAIEFTNVNEKLVDDLIEILRSLGITCSKKIDDRSDQKMTLPQGTIIDRRPYFRVFINTSKPIFKLPRKLDRIKKKATGGEDYVSIIDCKYLDKYEEMQCITVDSPDHTYLIGDYTVTHNSFLEGIYNILRMLLLPKRKIVITGGGFRQAKVVFDYMETIWHNAPLLRSIVASGSNLDSMGPKHMADMYTFRIADRICYAVPTGPSGDKVRGLRANDLIAEEFNSHSKIIFETVMAGFTAVSANPIENVKRRAMTQLAEQLGIELELTDDTYIKDNQLIISGTPGYTFQHFYEYWQDWKDIINSQGDPRKLGRYLERRQTEFGDSQNDVLSSLNWKDFAIIRIPFELIPKGFMDEAQVARAKATMHSGTYASEYAASFCDDSNGFFSRRLIESVVASPQNRIVLPSTGLTTFEGRISGDPQRQYVFGIDPASEVDNFAITIIEAWSDHRRLVYCWTTNDKQHKEEIKAGLTTELDFYSYCARKIRWLMKIFPCSRIMMDSQGGGKAVYERLHDQDKLQAGEQLIWEIVDDKKEKDSDHRAGLHILEMCQFSSADWVSEANHGLRFDMESKTLLFPFFDALSLISANAKDGFNTNRLYDTLEFCMEEIEELKNELSNIIITQTINGRDRWDTPETKMPGGKKGYMRKDRYSSLLLANSGARNIFLARPIDMTMPYGGFAGKNKTENGPTFIGNEFWAKALDECYKVYG